MKRVLVIGAGERVVGAVLPALWCLRDRFEVAGVLARTVKSLPVAGETVTTIDRLDAIDLRTIELVVVAVTTKQVPRVVTELARRGAAHLTLMLDTPVLPPAGLHATRHFRSFARVIVSEDTIALPPFVAARRLIANGEIGRLRRIFFFHCGYKYHALASLKMLASATTVTRISSRKFAGKRRIKDIELDNGVAAVMYEPRDYAIGKFLIEGEHGFIADYECARTPMRRLEYRLDGPVVRGVLVDGVPEPRTELDDLFDAGIDASVPDISPMGSMKIRGLLELLVAATGAKSPHYLPSDAISDNLQIQIVDKLGYLPAPSVLTRLLGLAVRS
ncbi:MAG: hypothetical protein H0V17_14810 [Deltaproteobacteria bacterium]|nr:hypothetical protein [Deltaproteobacteria bacterium]